MTMEMLRSHDHAKSFAAKLTADLYHMMPDLSNSGNNIILDESPAHYIHYRRNPPKSTPAMITGTHVHDNLLVPEEFAETTVVMPEMDRRTKAGKEDFERFAIENKGKSLLARDKFQQIEGMIKSVQDHPAASTILKNNHNELSFFTQIDGVKVRCRPDILSEGNILADLKTTEDASVEGFRKSLLKYKYYRQAAFYCDVVASVTGQVYDIFKIIAVEKHPPYAVQVFELKSATLERGREEYRRGLAIYRECLLTNKWPAYSDDVVDLELSNWGLSYE